MKNAVIALLIIFLVLFTIGISKDLILKSIITMVSSKVIGAPVSIDSFSLGIFNQAVKISGLKVYNPRGFSRGALIDIEKVNVAYDLGALLKKKIHLTSAEFELKEMLLEKNKQGALSVDALKVSKKEPAGKSRGQEQMPLEIDTLKLGIGKLIFKDYSGRRQYPSVLVYDMNIHKTYENIRSGRELAMLILAETMKSAGIQGVALYGVAAATGVAAFPLAIAANFFSKEKIEQEFSGPFARVYDAGLKALNQLGRVAGQDKDSGSIDAEVDGAQVNLKVNKKGDNTRVSVSARKYLFPKPEIAGGVLYVISEELNLR